MNSPLNSLRLSVRLRGHGLVFLLSAQADNRRAAPPSGEFIRWSRDGEFIRWSRDGEFIRWSRDGEFIR